MRLPILIRKLRTILTKFAGNIQQMFYTCNTTAGIYDSRQLSINADMLFGEPVNISTLFLSRAHLIVRAQL